jgi:hypothetical protein
MAPIDIAEAILESGGVLPLDLAADLMADGIDVPALEHNALKESA